MAVENRPLMHDVMADRLIQANKAPQNIRQVELLVGDFNGSYVYTEPTPDGKKREIELDNQVIKAMKGAQMGVLQELKSEGLEGQGDIVIFDNDVIGDFPANPRDKNYRDQPMPPSEPIR